jgi:hypothetical protein
MAKRPTVHSSANSNDAMHVKEMKLNGENCTYARRKEDRPPSAIGDKFTRGELAFENEGIVDAGHFRSKRQKIYAHVLEDTQTIDI